MSMQRFEGPLQVNLTEEVAAALGESARRLRRALDALSEFDAIASTGRGQSSHARRLDLVLEAGEKLWGYVVQRELVGLRDAEYIREQYRVPDEVWRSMGPKARMRKLS